VVSTLLDLVVVSGITLTTYLVWLLPGNPLGPLRVLVGGAFVLVLPGYVLTAVLFPGREPPLSGAAGGLAPASLSPLERLVCSVGLSLVSVPLVGLFLNYTQWGITQQSVVLALLWFVLITTALAAVRRLGVPPAERFRLRVDSGFTRPSGATLAIAALFVLSVGVAGTALATTDGGQRLTEFYLVAQDEETGEAVAGDYPTSIAPNGSAPVYVGLENHEAQTTDYTVLVEFHRVGTVDGERTVVSRTEQKRLTTTLRPGESDRTGVRISPPASAAGEQLRLTFMLYTGDVGETPRIADAYRTVHIWVDVPGGAA
jgi:uncharacterized membrane protein